MRNETRDKQVTRCKTERKKVVWKAPGTVAHVRSKFARGISTLFFFQVEIFARIKKRGGKNNEENRRRTCPHNKSGNVTNFNRTTIK